MKLRILITSDFYPPFIGGAERQAHLLGKELVARGHEVAVATVWHDKQAELEDMDGVQVHRLKGLATIVPWFSKDAKRRYHPPLPDPRITFGLRRLIKRFQPDVVHAQGWIAYSSAAALLGTKIPFIVSARDYGYSCATRTLLYNNDKLCDGPELRKCLGCARNTYTMPKALVAVGGVFAGRELFRRKLRGVHSVSTFVQHIVQRDLLGMRTPAARNPGAAIETLVIPDLVIVGEPEAAPDAKAQAVIDRLPAEPYMMFVGALQPHKGLGVLLEAYKQLDSPPPLVLMGTPWPDTPTEFPPGVTVFQNVPHRAVMASWRRCLFGIAPSVWPDPLPGVVREAMSQGKAMIATRVGGNTDMIEDGTTGLLVPPGDAEALRGAMERLLADEALCDRLGHTAQAQIDSFSAAAVLPRFEALYRRLVGAARNPKYAGTSA